MRYISEEDMPIFHEATRLREEAERLHVEWVSQVQKSYTGEISYNDTKPKFDEYLEAFNKWKQFQEQHAAILLAKIQN